MTDQVLLTREFGLANRVDPTGKIWTAAKTNRENALYAAAILRNEVPTQPGANCPEYLQGSFTSEAKVLNLIDKFLIDLWDKSDEQARRNIRTPAKAAVA